MRVPVRYFLSLAAAASLAGCEPDFSDEAPVQSAGSLDLSRYVAIGDDFTAGVANRSLSRAGQEYSFPNLLARQFRLLGGGEFVQPLLGPDERTGGFVLTGFTGQNQALLGMGPVTFLDSVRLNAGSPCSELQYQFPRWSDAGRIPNNLGIPNLKLSQLNIAGLGNEVNQGTSGYNAFYERILPLNSDRTYFSLIRAARPTFVTVSFGMGDLMTFIQSGGSCGSPLPSGSTLTAPLGRLADSLIAIPSLRGAFLGLPFASNLPLLSTTISSLNKKLGRTDTTSMFVLNSTGAVTRTVYNDVILLPMVSRIGRMENATGQPATAPFGLDPANPLRDQDVVSDRNISDLNGRINANNSINTVLKQKAAASGGRFIYLDLGTFYLNLAKGAYINGVSYNSDPVTGGVYNYDGYTFSPRGNALLANAIIDLLADSDKSFGVKVPLLDVNQFPATPLP